MINHSTIYVESGYSNMITGIMLYRQSLSIPFPFGTDWSNICVGAGIRMDDLSSGYGACGVTQDRMFWFGVNDGRGTGFGWGNFAGINSSVYLLTGQSVNVIDLGGAFNTPVFPEFQPPQVTTGGLLIGYAMSPTGLAISGQYFNPVNTVPFFPATNQDAINYPLTSGDYRYVILRYTKDEIANTSSIYACNDKRNYEPGIEINLLVKSPNIHTLEAAMDNFFSFPVTGTSGFLGSMGAINTFFIYSPVSGLKLSPIFIKRYA